jgi:hypothetical protein
VIKEAVLDAIANDEHCMIERSGIAEGRIYTGKKFERAL